MLELLGKLRRERDETEDKKVEEELRQKDEGWGNAFDSISDFVSVHDKEFRIVRVNKALADFLNMNPEDLIGKHCYEVFHGTKEPWSNCPHAKTLEMKKAVTEEINDPHSGVPLQVTTSPIFDEKGELVGSVHIAKDISERKEAEEKIKELSLFPERNPNPIFNVGKEGEMLYYNPGVFNYVDDAKKVKDILPANYKELVGEACKSGEKVKVEHRYKDSYIDYVIYPVSDKAAHIYGRDITDRKKTEKALQESEAWFRLISENASDLLAVLNLEGGFLYASPSFQTQFGLTSDELLGMKFMDILHPDDVPRVMGKIQKLVTTRSACTAVCRFKYKGSEWRIFESLGTLIEDDNGNPSKIIVVARDITERKKSEDELKSKVEELERFHKLAVGREMKMMELKERIKELEGKK